MSDLRFISADSHVQESDEFKMRVPAPFRERLPHTEIINGGAYQIVEGVSLAGSTLRRAGWTKTT